MNQNAKKKHERGKMTYMGIFCRFLFISMNVKIVETQDFVVNNAYKNFDPSFLINLHDVTSCNHKVLLPSSQ
jgi:hypothetical protein